MPAARGGDSATQDATVGVDFEMPPLSVFAEITSRPLFSPSRRPAPPAEISAAEPQAPPAELDEFLLRGIAIADGGRVALLERRSTGALTRVLEGQSLDGWQIAAIRPGEVALLDGDREVVLEIELDKSPPMSTRRSVRRGEMPPGAPMPEAGEIPRPPWLAQETELPAGVPPEHAVPYEMEYDPEYEEEYGEEFETDDAQFDPHAD